jgi:hypothetical protein
VTPPTDATLAYWKGHREQLRRSENQRASSTNYVLVVVSAMPGFCIQQRLRPVTIPLEVSITVAGVYGALAVAKDHERAEYQLAQARVLPRTLVTAGALDDNGAVLTEVRLAHYENYPRLTGLRLHLLGTALHLTMAVFGVVLIVVTLIRFHR